MDGIKRVLKGIGVTPRRVAAARGVVEVAVLAGLAAGGEAALRFADVELPIQAKALAVLGIGWVIRFLEGEADHHIDPELKRLA